MHQYQLSLNIHTAVHVAIPVLYCTQRRRVVSRRLAHAPRIQHADYGRIDVPSSSQTLMSQYISRVTQSQSICNTFRMIYRSIRVSPKTEGIRTVYCTHTGSADQEVQLGSGRESVDSHHEMKSVTSGTRGRWNSFPAARSRIGSVGQSNSRDYRTLHAHHDEQHCRILILYCSEFCGVPNRCTAVHSSVRNPGVPLDLPLKTRISTIQSNQGDTGYDTLMHMCRSLRDGRRISDWKR